MAKWKMLLLMALLGLALGLQSVSVPGEGRLVVQLTALGALLAFFVICYLWWKVLALFVRIALLLAAAVGVALVLHRLGIVGA